MMTKRDFMAIAEVLRVTGAPKTTMLSLADVFATRNPGFDRHRFVEAATPTREAFVRAMNDELIARSGVDGRCGRGK